MPSVGYLQSRQYSLSDAPRPDYYRITIKRDPGMHYSNSVSTTYMHAGVVSNYVLDEKRAGDEIEVSHPAGEFMLDGGGSSVPVVLISAGVGCTPVMSMLNAVVESQPGRPVCWVHGAHRSVCFGEHIKAVCPTTTTTTTTTSRYHPNVRCRVFKTALADSDLVGLTYDYDRPMDLRMVAAEDLFLNNGSTEYFISGPEQFLVEMADYLTLQGVDRSRIRFELFGTGELEFKKH